MLKPHWLRIHGMTYAGCVARVERALKSLPGVRAARINLVTELAVVERDDPGPEPSELLIAVRSVGYDAEWVHPATDGTPMMTHAFETHLREQRQTLIQAMGLAAPIIGIHWIAPLLQSPDRGGSLWPRAIQAILCAVLLLSSGGAPILVGGVRGILHFRPSRELFISAGAVLAFLAGIASLFSGTPDGESLYAVGMILALFNLGRYLETLAKRAASADVHRLKTGATLDHWDRPQVPFDKTGLRRFADRVVSLMVPLVIVLVLMTLIGTLWFTKLGWGPAVNRCVAVLVVACPTALGLAAPVAAWVATGMVASGRSASPVLVHRTKRVIQQNLLLGFGYHLVGIPLAALGNISPGMAAAAMMVLSIVVILNALRLRNDVVQKKSPSVQEVSGTIIKEKNRDS